MYHVALNLMKVVLLGSTLMGSSLALAWAVDRMYRRWRCGVRRKP